VSPREVRTFGGQNNNFTIFGGLLMIESHRVCLNTADHHRSPQWSHRRSLQITR